MVLYGSAANTVKKIVIISIIVGGLLIRIVNLSNNPVGFFCDEASFGYNAYILLLHGTDEYGQHLPLFFRSYGEYKSPVQMYTTVPFVALFGLNEFATRLPSAMLGTLTIFALYLTVKELCRSLPLFQKNQKCLALTASFLLAISPWHIHFSRIAFEMMPFVLFTTLSFYTALKGRSTFTILFLTLAAYSYFPARIFVPLFSIGIFRLLLQKKGFQKTFITGLAYILFCLPLIQHMVWGPGMERFKQVSIFQNKEMSAEEKYKHIFDNYVAHFSPAFLFTKGDIDYPGQFITRHSVRGMGELYLWQVPFILAGTGYMLYVVINKRQWKLFLIVFWLLLYPLGSAFTNDAGPQATRSIIGVVPFQIVTAFGIGFCFAGISKFVHQMRLGTKAVALAQSSYVIALTAVVVTSFTQYLFLYFHEYPLYSADFWGWQYGPKEIISYFKQHQSDYDELYMEGAANAPDIFLKFYDVDKTCTKCSLGIPQERFTTQKRQLFAVTPQTLSTFTAAPLEKKDVLYYPDKTVAFYLVSKE